jgi:hypothetical protein
MAYNSTLSFLLTLMHTSLITGETLERASALVRERMNGNKEFTDAYDNYLQSGVISGRTAQAIQRLIGEEMGLSEETIAKHAKLILGRVNPS